LGIATAMGASVERSVPVCLSLSPFRAYPGLASTAPNPETARDQVLEAMRSRRDSAWTLRAAGNCPDGLPVLDVFQNPGDLVRSSDGTALRFRLEWHHQEGPTEFYVTCPHDKVPRPDSLAIQLLAVSQQMVARVEMVSNPESVDLQVLNLGGLKTRTPLLLKTPPGVVSVTFLHEGQERRKDTLVGVGGLYQMRADFQPIALVPEAHRKWKPPTWPFWVATAAAVVATGILEAEQLRAQRSYSNLGPDDSQARYDQSWSDLRRSNVLRNVSLGLTLVLGAGSSWWQWGGAR
jgi:hypothetical protein